METNAHVYIHFCSGRRWRQTSRPPMAWDISGMATGTGEDVFAQVPRPLGARSPRQSGRRRQSRGAVAKVTHKKQPEGALASRSHQRQTGHSLTGASTPNGPRVGPPPSAGGGVRTKPRHGSAPPLQELPPGAATEGRGGEAGNARAVNRNHGKCVHRHDPDRSHAFNE